MAAAQNISCANCACAENVMKRCTGCRQVFYCSRECQRKHWPSHKSECTKSSKLPAGINKSFPAEKTPHPCKGNSYDNEKYFTGINDCANGNISASLSSEGIDRQCGTSTSECHSCEQKGPQNPLPSTIRITGLKQAECLLVTHKQGEATQSCNDETESNPSHTDDCREEEELGNSSVAIFIKHNKTKHSLSIPTHCIADGKSMWQRISDFLHIPGPKLKLIHKGKMVTQTNIGSFMSERAVFQAFGEVAEPEDGLEKKDIELIMCQAVVERNVAIRALRKSGDVVDAIIDLGNE